MTVIGSVVDLKLLLMHNLLTSEACAPLNKRQINDRMYRRYNAFKHHEWMDGYNYFDIERRILNVHVHLCMAHRTTTFKYKCTLNIVRHDRKSN